MKTERALHLYCPQPERRTGSKIGIKGTQMRAFNTEGKAEPKPGVGVTRELMREQHVDLCGQNTDKGQGSREGIKAKRAGALTPVMVLNAEPRVSRNNVARNVCVS